MRSATTRLALLLLVSASCTHGQTPNDFDHLKLRTGREPGPVAIADFNRDGRNDIAIGNTADGTVTIYLNQGDGTFREARGSPFKDAANPNDLAVADVNRDSNPDLVI